VDRQGKCRCLGANEEDSRGNPSGLAATILRAALKSRISVRNREANPALTKAMQKGRAHIRAHMTVTAAFLADRPPLMYPRRNGRKVSIVAAFGRLVVSMPLKVVTGRISAPHHVYGAGLAGTDNNANFQFELFNQPHIGGLTIVPCHGCVRDLRRAGAAFPSPGAGGDRRISGRVFHRAGHQFRFSLAVRNPAGCIDRKRGRPRRCRSCRQTRPPTGRASKTTMTSLVAKRKKIVELAPILWEG